ncbi:nuclear transport factor 2 family protein [Amnibacterium endophyticum]|uniref:Nuclear transport factor 2 family protein n=1 Tax=Amnibacterium endophyticum TaxID=2109337 RepID=A0ABW4LIP5_9MICO
MTDRAAAAAWADGYERAWRAADPALLDGLFTPDAVYRRSPVEPPVVGLEAIRGIWAEDEGAVFDLETEVVAAEGDRAVIRSRVHYRDPDQEYVDLWVLRFAEDGLAVEFEEWPYWPGRGYTAAQER